MYNSEVRPKLNCQILIKKNINFQLTSIENALNLSYYFKTVFIIFYGLGLAVL